MATKNHTDKQVQKQDTKPVEILTREEATAKLNKCISAPVDPNDLIDNFRKEVLPGIRSEDKKERKKWLDEFSKKSYQYAMSVGLLNHYHVAETTAERRQPLLLSITRELIKEHDCKTVSEILLAEMAAIHYGRMLSYSIMLSANSQTGSNPITHERNGLYSAFGKEIERASRQYLATISTLKQLKNPPIEINVKAKTAFVGQNQQFNATQEIKTNDPQ